MKPDACDKVIAQKLQTLVVDTAVRESTNGDVSKELCAKAAQVVGNTLSEGTVEEAKRAFEVDTRLRRGVAREKDSIENLQQETG